MGLAACGLQSLAAQHLQLTESCGTDEIFTTTKFNDDCWPHENTAHTVFGPANLPAVQVQETAYSVIHSKRLKQGQSQSVSNNMCGVDIPQVVLSQTEKQGTVMTGSIPQCDKGSYVPVNF